MDKFILKELKTDNILKELEDIKFDETYAPKAVNKYEYKNIKIYGLTAAQANILKQNALSLGADCATPRETITGDIESADCILGGSLSTLKKIAAGLSNQPFKLKELSEAINNFIDTTQKAPKTTKIMGILNVTQNSFSDGGVYFEYENAIKHLNELIQDGADIIDIGAESTKPYSQPVSAEKQLEKLLPILSYIEKNNIKIPVSIDTRNSTVAKQCLDTGVKIINDVSGLDYDNNMAKIAAEYNCNVVIQHSKGTPDNMQNNPKYKNLTDEIYLDLYKKLQYATENGIKRENIIIDPGIGFGKTREQNFEIIRKIEEFRGLGCPIMLGLSRKSLLNMPDVDNNTKDIYSTALNALTIEKKVNIIRVHNVKMHRTLIDILSAQ